jgi:hypothetical protein
VGRVDRPRTSLVCPPGFEQGFLDQVVNVGGLTGEPPRVGAHCREDLLDEIATLQERTRPAVGVAVW